MSGSWAACWSRSAAFAAALGVVVCGTVAGSVLASSAPASSAAVTSRGAHHTSPKPLECDAGTPKITETGTGTVSITPNLLTLSLDVHTTAALASSALSQNDRVTAAVLHALSSGGIARRDLQTTDLTIEPNYAHTGTTVSGYGVDNTVVAKIRKFSTAGTVIDAAVAAGGNATRIDSLSFSLTQPLRAQARARDLAVREAISHAKAIAASAGARIRGICSIDDETSTSTTTPIVPNEVFHAAAASAPVPVESGSETVTARVSIVFAL